MLQDSKIQSGLNIYDYANILLGGFDNIITLIQANPKFESLNVSLDSFKTQQIVYDDQYYQATTIQIQLPISAPINTIKSIQGFKGQNIYDLNLACYSGFDNVIKFCIDNNINSTNDHDVSLKDFTFDTNLNTNLSLNAVVNKKQYVFATGINSSGFILQEDGYFILQENGFKIEY